MPDFESMTDEEIVQYKLDRKIQVQVINVEIDEAHVHHENRVRAWHLNEAITQLTKAAARDGRSIVDEAKWWLYDEDAEDRGHRVQAKLYLRSEGII